MKSTHASSATSSMAASSWVSTASPGARSGAPASRFGTKSVISALCTMV
jgi:hypothetical protein